MQKQEIIILEISIKTQKQVKELIHIKVEEPILVPMFWTQDQDGESIHILKGVDMKENLFLLRKQERESTFTQMGIFMMVIG